MALRGTRPLALAALLAGTAACGGGTAVGEDATPPDAAAPVTEEGADPATLPQTPGDTLTLPQQQ